MSIRNSFSKQPRLAWIPACAGMTAAFFLRLPLILLGIIAINSHAYQNLDRAIALVEDKVILQSQLEQRLAHLTTKQPNVRITNTIKKQVLEQLISERLQLNVAEKVNLNISNAEVENAIAQIKQRLENDDALTFEDYLTKQSMNEEQLREAIRQDLTLQKIQEGNINNRLRITDREVDEFLESKAGQEWIKTRFRLAHILLPVQGNNDSAAIAEAQSLYLEAKKNPARFEELAVAHSKGPNAPKGGDLGWRQKEELPSLFIEQVATLKAGDITPPFRSGAGVHLLKVIQRSGAEPVMVKRFKVRHILITPTELFTEAEAKAKIDGIYQQLRDGANFSELAREYTEDTGSKADGGDVGWSVPGKFVPAFEQTMQETPVGTISKPFRSQFGWHILKVEDTRIEDMFDVVKRNQVVSILRKRRFQDELQLWIQELREDAYVEILI